MTDSSKRQVLIVEDEALIRMTTVDMLDELGHGYVEAANGTEALEQLEKHPEIEILLTDLGLPGMSGQALIAEALKRRPALKVLVASGYGSTTEGLKDAHAGQIRFLNKPFQMSQLRDAIAQV
jgi:DNA-binding NtrC family response regulator